MRCFVFRVVKFSTNVRICKIGRPEEGASAVHRGQIEKELVEACFADPGPLSAVTTL